jgi:hypothetical protein
MSQFINCKVVIHTITKSLIIPCGSMAWKKIKKMPNGHQGLGLKFFLIYW